MCIVRELHREFQRAGSDVLQALTFYGSEDKLENRGNYAGKVHSVCITKVYIFVICLNQCLSFFLQLI